VPVDLDLAYMPAAELARRIADGELSPLEAVSNSLARIEEVNQRLNCFCFVWSEEALAAARTASDTAARRDTRGPLHGVPVALKDTTPTAGHTTTLGSFTHEHWVPQRDAYIAGALKRAGAIIVGKTTTPEFAHSSVTDSPLWGVTRNPWNLKRSPGGSSGGSGAAVASGCVPLAEGTDMGGSVRIPAAWCGVVGLKPGLGRIPMDILPGLFDTLSHHGPLARCVDDARLFVAAVQGPDDADILSVTSPLDLAAGSGPRVQGMRIAFSADLGCWDVAPDVASAVRSASFGLRDLGMIVEEVGVGLTPRDEDVWEELWGVFMAAYYGQFVAEYGERMDPDVLALIDRGNQMSAVQLKRLDIERTDLWRRLAKVFSTHDAIVCPTMAAGPVPAAKADRQVVARPADGRSHSVDMTAVFNLAAPCPALSVPCGWDAEAMPVGLQVIGRRWREDTVLAIGQAFEQSIPSARRRPEL
jgi:Asp-tRNA(Asn)/Glu-tRNA(Gln) amidotransferase A subunit family amidase